MGVEYGWKSVINVCQLLLKLSDIAFMLYFTYYYRGKLDDNDVDY